MEVSKKKNILSSTLVCEKSFESLGVWNCNTKLNALNPNIYLVWP